MTNNIPSSGFIFVDKPQQATSFDAIAALRKALRIKKIGHAGTLDPLATGLLVIGFGNATRALQYMTEHDKTYETTIVLGVATTTDDAEGECEHLSEAEYVRRMNVLNALKCADITALFDEHFHGIIEQRPSSVSAIKVDGKRAYDLVRNGEQVELPARAVWVGDVSIERIYRHDVSVIVDSQEKTLNAVVVDARITCSSGTYIRAIARDLGAYCEQVGGHVQRLRRISVGNFDLVAENSADDMRCDSGDAVKRSTALHADDMACAESREHLEYLRSVDTVENIGIAGISERVAIVDNTIVGNVVSGDIVSGEFVDSVLPTTSVAPYQYAGRIPTVRLESVMKTFQRHGEEVTVRQWRVVSQMVEHLEEYIVPFATGLSMAMDSCVVSDGATVDLRYGRSVVVGGVGDESQIHRVAHKPATLERMRAFSENAQRRVPLQARPCEPHAASAHPTPPIAALHYRATAATLPLTRHELTEPAINALEATLAPPTLAPPTLQADDCEVVALTVPKHKRGNRCTLQPKVVFPAE